MDTTKTLTNEEVIKELLAMLQQNAMREQANDVFELCSYVDSLEKKIDAMTQEITNMQNEIKEMKEDSLESKAKQMLSDATGRLNTGYQSIRSSVQETKEQVKTTARSIVDEAKIKGKEALFRVSEFFGIKEKLLNGRESVKESLRATDQSMAKISLLGKGLSDAGHLAANTIRTFADQPEVDYSQKSQKHTITDTILKPFKAYKKLLTSTHLFLDASIDKLDNLSADVKLEQEKREADVKKDGTADRNHSLPAHISMVAEDQPYQYNADIFEARSNEMTELSEKMNPERTIKEPSTKKENKSR